VNVQVVNGVQFGDLVSFMDFAFLARVARVNAATIWSLAPPLAVRSSSRLERVMTFSGAVLRWYFWIHIIAGWVLTTLWVGGLTGLLKT
jgi:hypothetical protein